MSADKHIGTMSADELVATFPEMTPIQRVIALNDGTVQTALSALFGDEIVVNVISQSVIGDTISRAVELCLAGTGEQVCFAASTINVNKNSDSLVSALLNEDQNIGEVICELPTVRRIIYVHSGNGTIERMYRISTPSITTKENSVDILITEAFNSDQLNGKRVDTGEQLPTIPSNLQNLTLVESDEVITGESP